MNMKTFLTMLTVVLMLLLASCSTPSDSVPESDNPVLTIANGEPRPISFESADGAELNGTLFGSGKKGVIFSNMNQGDDTAWQELAEEIADQGYVALTYNYQGLGRSAEVRAQKVDDLNGAIALMQAEGVDEIVLVGASVGGAASIKAAVEFESAGLIVMSTPTLLQGLMVTEEDLQAISAPKLFLNSEVDRYGSSPDSQLMFDMASEPKSLFYFPGNAHGTELFDGAEKDAVFEKITAFVAESLE